MKDDNIRTILPVKSDIVFRMFFADERDTNDLIRFLKAILKLPEDDYNEIEISDPHLLREYVEDKLAIIDVKLRTKSGNTIHIEIQLKVTSELKNRIIYYSSKLITEQIGKGDDYNYIKKVISIIITEENIIPKATGYHHRFVMYDQDAGVEFTDLMEIHTLELGKVPIHTDGTDLYDWAKFIDAETEEELNMVVERNSQFQSTVVKLREMSADEKARDLYERREKARRDHDMFIRDAERRGIEQGIERGAVRERHEFILKLSKKMNIEQIAEVTDFTVEEVKEILSQQI